MGSNFVNGQPRELQTIDGSGSKNRRSDNRGSINRIRYLQREFAAHLRLRRARPVGQHLKPIPGTVAVTNEAFNRDLRTVLGNGIAVNRVYASMTCEGAGRRVSSLRLLES